MIIPRIGDPRVSFPVFYLIEKAFARAYTKVISLMDAVVFDTLVLWRPTAAIELRSQRVEQQMLCNRHRT